MFQGKPAVSKQGRRRSIIILIIAALLFGLMAEVTYIQGSRIRQTLNQAAYTNMENSLKNLSNMMTNTFLLDKRYAQVLASSLSGIEDKQARIQTMEYDTSSIYQIYYGIANAQTAVGKDGKRIDLSEREFVEHANGIVRSKVFMEDIGTFAYILREPVNEEGKTVGYLYIEYLTSRFNRLLPQNVANGNDVSVMDAETFHYIYIPSISSSGVHINFRKLGVYLKDPSQADAAVAEIEEVVRSRQYYMNIFRMNTFGSEQSEADYVVFLWPVDDGEYYLSGFTKVDFLQSERVSVENTISTMAALLVAICIAVLVLLAIFFLRTMGAARSRAALQEKHSQELDAALQVAKAANESKSNFLSNMSHDIRTPMNAIIGYTTLINREADEPGKVREYTRKISSAGDYLLGLINDVLDMSKIESGKTTLNIAQFYIRELVSEVESIVRMQANAKRQEFSVTVEEVDHDCVVGDELRIRQIILNLLSNALKYTPNGGKIDFIVRGIPQEKAKIQKLRIIVRDTGYGMESGYMKSIFEPFTRLDNSMTGKIQGTGLGLAITKSIVDLMGGTITVNSVLNKGSTFTVDLELPVAENDAIAVTCANGEDDGSFTLSGLHILAAEDNELNAEILLELLHMEGVDCDICEDGEKTLRKFEGSPPGTYDLLLMDVQMPKMNGYEATKAIRACAHLDAKTIPIVAMTANAFAEDVMDALQAGMDAHIAKPVDMDTLRKTLSKVLKNKKGS